MRCVGSSYAMQVDFSYGSDVYQSAQIVQRGDADRFAAAMVAPLEMRARLFVIFAFNIEVSRAPWQSQEPMIARMRLQWWLDGLAQIEQGAAPQRHAVLTPLADMIKAPDVVLLRELVEAREADIERAPFTDERALWDYLDKTSGHLLRVSSGLRDGAAGNAARRFGQAVNS